MITAELRRAILTATGLPGADPLLRPGPAPGRYASSLPFRLARRGQDPREVAADLAARLGGEPWIEAAEATGAGYLTVAVTHDALARLAVRVTLAGPACAASDALRGRTLPAPPPPDLAAEPGWPQAQAALAAHLTAHLAAAAGATMIFYPERAVVPPPAPVPRPVGTPPIVSAEPESPQLTLQSLSASSFSGSLPPPGPVPPPGPFRLPDLFRPPGPFRLPGHSRQPSRSQNQWPR